MCTGMNGISFSAMFIRWYSVNARAQGLASGANAPRTLHVGWGEFN
jgi:hypothetical protein